MPYSRILPAAAGVAITSITQPIVGDRTVRQTGAVAYALSTLVDEKITAQFKRVSMAASASTPKELARLPEIDVA